MIIRAKLMVIRAKTKVLFCTKLFLSLLRCGKNMKKFFITTQIFAYFFFRLIYFSPNHTYISHVSLTTSHQKICVFSDFSNKKICVFSDFSNKKICVFSDFYLFLHS